PRRRSRGSADLRAAARELPAADPPGQEAVRKRIGLLVRELAEEVEVTALVGLEYVLEEERTVAAPVLGTRCRGVLESPPAPARGPPQVEAPPRDVEHDWVPVLDSSQRPAGCRLGRDVEDDRPEGSATHPRIRDANEIGDATAQQLLRNWQLPP